MSEQFDGTGGVGGTGPVGGGGGSSSSFGPADVTGMGNASGAPATPAITRRVGGHTGTSRAKQAREARRAAQFAKFRLTELNLVPLVDTLVSIVFFGLTTAAVGDMTVVMPGVTLPESSVGVPALKELTLGVANDLTLSGHKLMSTADAARAQSNMPNEPLIIPALRSALQKAADSVRTATHTPTGQPLKTPLAIQGSKTMRYDLLARIMQTARHSGFSKISLQVQRTGAEGSAGVPVRAN
ncbi:MAG TPA: biopolymer transporter ExbD [Gemmatimonadaceae bacterium]|nr:biopolymer transporter ExbD [Gemmatimonadaceae bacterium]